MPSINIKPLRLAGQLTTDYHDMVKRVVREVQVEVKGGLAIVDDEIARSRPLPVDRGLYRRSWRTQDTPTGCTLYSDSPYAAIIELGRRPGGRLPPVSLIADWVMRKGLARLNGPQEEVHGPTQRGVGRAAFTRRYRASSERARAMSIAWLIARAIGKRGQKGHFILKRTREFLDIKVAKAVERAMIQHARAVGARQVGG
jgi:hypothetical protein